jgi:hypothetical protein
MAQDNELFARYNYDDVFNRTVIVGLLYLLNHEVYYEQIWDTNVVENVCVPFMYDFGSSDERFAQDNYTFFGKACFGDRKIDGKFDMLPRGAVKYTGSQIDASNMTHRFIQGRFLKNENGKLTSYIANMMSIPLTFNFEVEMWIDNIVTAFKIEQALREAFYKNRRYDVLFRGLKIPCRAGFPESHNLDKTVSYAFDAERQLKLTFSLSVETYQPVFYNADAIEASKRIEKIAWDIEVRDVEPILQTVKLKPIDNSVIYPSGSTILIEWETNSNVSDMCTICLSWYGVDGKHHLIDSPRLNTRHYYWTIPSDFSGFVNPNIVYDDNTKVLVDPVLKIIPDYNTKLITEKSFVIVDPGKFLGEKDYEMPITLDYTDSKGNVILSTAYSLHIVDGEVVDVLMNGEPMKYTENCKPKRITLQLTYPLNANVNDKISNILIL